MKPKITIRLCLFFSLIQKAIDTLNPKELRQLLNYRSTDKSSLSSLRARSYDLLRTNYLSTKSRLQTILDKQKYVFIRHIIKLKLTNEVVRRVANHTLASKPNECLPITEFTLTKLTCDFRVCSLSSFLL